MFDFLTPKIRREVLQYFHENKGFIPFTSSEFIEFLRQNGVKNPIELINVDNFYQFLEGERLEIEAYIRDTLQIIFQYEKYPEKNWNYLGEFFNPCVLNKKEKIALLHEWGMRNPISWLGKNKFMYGYFYANTKVENWQRKKDFFEKI